LYEAGRGSATKLITEGRGRERRKTTDMVM